MEYNEIKHEIEYINLKNENYDLKKDILLKDYNLNIKENNWNKTNIIYKRRIRNLLNEIKDLKNKIEKDI